MTNFPLDELLEWQPRLQLGRVNHQELTVDQGYGAGIGVSSQGIPTNEQLSQATRLELESRKGISSYAHGMSNYGAEIGVSQGISSYAEGISSYGNGIGVSQGISSYGATISSYVAGIEFLGISS